MARKLRKSKGTWATHEHEIFEGAGKMFRTAQSGETSQFSNQYSYNGLKFLKFPFRRFLFPKKNLNQDNIHDVK